MTRVNIAWGRWIMRHRVAVLVITGLCILQAPLSYHRLFHDNSNESYFLEHDPNLLAFRRLVDRFGDPDYLLVGVETPAGEQDVFNAGTIAMIDQITRFLEDHRHVTQVRSLSKYQYTHDDGGLLSTDDLFEDIDELADDPAALARARDIMAGEQLPKGLLITSDLKNTQIIARTVYHPGENRHKVEVTQELLAFIDQQGYREKGYRLHLSGVPVIGERFETLTQSDMAWINPVMTVVMVVILVVIFRSLFATLVPMLAIGVTMLVITGIQGWLRFPFTAVNSALLPTIIILCIGACVHVLVEFYQFRSAGESPQESATHTISDLFFPVFFTCLTTAIGFLALAVTELKPVREFALLAALAPLIIFVVVMSALPAILSYVPWLPGNQRQQSEGGEDQSMESILTRQQANTPTYWLTHKIPGFIQRRQLIIVTLGVMVTVFSLYSVTKLHVDANIVNYFKKDSWMNQDLFYFNQTFKGISNLEVIIDSGEEGGVKNPQLLQRADELQHWLMAFDQTGKPTSILDFYKQINQSLHADDPAWFRLPDSRELAAQLLLLYDNTGPNEDLTDLKDFDERFLRLRIPVLNMDETDTTRLIDRLQEGVAKQFPDLNLEMTGNLIMNNEQNRYVNNGMFRSFGLAILTIGVCFIVLFRSFKYGMLALVPSVVPVLLTGGLVSMAGVAMDLGTMIVGAMTIGIAVDDSIHLMSRYLLMRRRGFDVHEAIQFALHSSGRAVILTSIILVSGFSVMLLGSFVSYIYVGLFSAMIMTLALVGDIIFMPALLYLLDGKSSSRGSAREDFNPDNNKVSGNQSRLLATDN